MIDREGLLLKPTESDDFISELLDTTLVGYNCLGQLIPEKRSIHYPVFVTAERTGNALELVRNGSTGVDSCFFSVSILLLCQISRLSLSLERVAEPHDGVVWGLG